MVRRPKLGPMRCSGAQPGASSGKGLLGSPHFPGGRGEKLPVPLEGRLLPGAICIWSIKTRAVVICQWPWGGRQGLPMRGV